MFFFFYFCADNRYTHISKDSTTTQYSISKSRKRPLVKINTLSNIVSNENHDIIDFAFSTSVIISTLTDTTFSPNALFWDIISVPNTVVSRGTPVFKKMKTFFVFQIVFEYREIFFLVYFFSCSSSSYSYYSY